MSMRLALIDDDPLFRTALRSLLFGLDPHVQIAESAGFTSSVRRSVELVLLDYHLPDSCFSTNLVQARRYFPSAKIVVVSADESPVRILEAIELGAAGFIPKSADPEVLIAALRIALLGQIYLPQEVMKYANAFSADVNQRYAALSDAQKRVLDKVLAGKANKVIAIELGLALGTVKSHLSMAFKALGVRNRNEAVVALSKDHLDVR